MTGLLSRKIIDTFICRCSALPFLIRKRFSYRAEGTRRQLKERETERLSCVTGGAYGLYEISNFFLPAAFLPDISRIAHDISRAVYSLFLRIHRSTNDFGEIRVRLTLVHSLAFVRKYSFHLSHRSCACLSFSFSLFLWTCFLSAATTLERAATQLQARGTNKSAEKSR